MRRTTLFALLVSMGVTLPTQADTSAVASLTTDTQAQQQLDGWRILRGNWTSPASGTINASGNFDNRIISENPVPVRMEWPVTIDHKDGWSAAAMIWASPDGQDGYAVRLDTRYNKIVLEKVGAWPQVEQIDFFPWTQHHGTKIEFRIATHPNAIRVYAPAISEYPILEALDVTPAGMHNGLQVIDAVASFTTQPVRPAPQNEPIVAHVPRVGEFQHIYDPGVDEENPWYINDHCFIKGEDGWHMFGITHEHPAAPLDEKAFAHAISPEFPGSLETWKKQPHALEVDPSVGEDVLWAPHVFKKDDLYYMFYCAGSQKGGAHYRMHLATSPDLKTWTRHPNNPIFKDTFDARDPMILEEGGTYYMYYTNNMDRNVSNHIVSLRTSKDLLNWSPASIVIKQPVQGTIGGETESPTVIKYGDHWYMFIGPTREYHQTTVYRSSNPLFWDYANEIAAFPSHAAEVVQDEDGNWFATAAGWDKHGVYVAPMTWEPVKPGN